MKIICTQENLKVGLSVVSRVVGTSNSLPILGTVLLKTEDGQLTLAATNLEVGVQTKIRCKIEVEGSVCLPAKIFNEVVQNLPNGNVIIEVSLPQVSVVTDQVSTKLRGLPADDFPLLPASGDGFRIAVPCVDLKGLLESVSFAVSTNQTQPEITGVLCKFFPHAFRTVATDRYRLSEKTYRLEQNLDAREAIVPIRAVGELLRLVNGSTAQVDMVFTDNQLSATLGETQLVSRLIDGQYPDYEQYLPTQFGVTVTLDASELAHAVKVSGLFSQSSQSISLAYNEDDQVLVVASGSQDVGESSIVLPGKVVGGSGTLLLNYRYIWDVVSGRSGEVVLHIVNETAPVILTFGNEEGYRYLIVPIKS